MKAQQLWFTEPGTVELREEKLPPLGENDILVRSWFSAISAGTEMLVYRHEVPETMTLDETLPGSKNQRGYPCQYGYAMVGKIDQVGAAVATDWLGKLVFAFQPHASCFITKTEQVFPLPEEMDPLAALFLANMETAVNLIQDAAPLLGERVVVLGQGVVGLLVSSLLTDFPLEALYAIETLEARRHIAQRLGVERTFHPGFEVEMHALKQALQIHEPTGGADLVFELSGNPEALNLAIEISGFASRIVVGSWYGKKSATLNFGDRFHRNRIRLISSQVSTIAPHLSGRWNKSRRMDMAMEMIARIHPEQFITHRIPFASAADAYRLLDQTPEDVLQAVFVYGDQGGPAS